MLFAVNQNTCKQVFLGIIRECHTEYVYVTLSGGVHKMWYNDTWGRNKLVVVCPD